MELKKVIENRRSIRAFKKTNVNNEIIKDILNCGRLAPSAKNRQPWYFVVVKDEIKDKIAELMLNDTTNNTKEERKKLKCPSSVAPTAKVIKEAPILVLIFRDKDENWNIGDSLSIGACVENICLRATDLGLGSLWIRDIVYVADEVAKMLNHEDLDLNCAVSIGYPNQSPKARPRKELKDIIEWIS